MEAVDVLMAEHRQIESVLGALMAAVERGRNGEPLPLAGFEEAARFIRGYADGLHHEKEEKVLFTAMAEAGMPIDGGPLGVMLHEHVVGRTFVKEMVEGVSAMRADRNALEAVLAPAEGYAQLLGSHIMKEDRILYPMSMRLLTPDLFDVLLARFKEIDAGREGEFATAAAAAVKALGATGR